jgi:hypothetical protein
MRWEFSNHVIDTNVTDEHIKELSETMQKEDKDSIEALTNKSIYESLKASVDNSIESTVWLVDNKVAAIIGISQTGLLSDKACPWCICSDEIKKFPKLFLRGSWIWTQAALKRYKWLENIVDARHKRSIRWLKWLGFTIYPAVPVGPNGMLFHKDELKEM